MRSGQAELALEFVEAALKSAPAASMAGDRRACGVTGAVDLEDFLAHRVAPGAELPSLSPWSDTGPGQRCPVLNPADCSEISYSAA